MIDFKALSPSTFLHLILSDLVPPQLSFAGQLHRLRDSLTILAEVKPLDASQLAFTHTEKWTASSLINETRQAIFPLPAGLFCSRGSLSASSISIFLEMAPSRAFILTPLRRCLHRRETSAFDFLRSQPLTSAFSPSTHFSLPIRVPRHEELIPKFVDLFRSLGLMKQERSTLTFRHLMFDPEAETRLEIKETGFRITSSNLTALWSLYGAFQRHIKLFLGTDAEVVSVDDLRRECAVLEGLEMQIASNQRSMDLQQLLDVYGFLRNSRAFSLFSSFVHRQE